MLYVKIVARGVEARVALLTRLKDSTFLVLFVSNANVHIQFLVFPLMYEGAPNYFLKYVVLGIWLIK
ncbi:hypothetical protein OC709_02450, partial ['Planchonia careya' phytoplasma]